MEKDNTALFKYLLFIADNSLILGHRLSEWCGHGPSLETDIALTNIALDLVGHARSYYCLLYTSPSPRDRTRSRMPSSA